MKKSICSGQTDKFGPKIAHCLGLLCSLSFALTCIFVCITFTGKEKMTMNVHLLQHLPLCVRQLGPLRSFSCFAFENLNGFLNGCINRNRYIPLQVSCNLSCSVVLWRILLQIKDIYGVKVKLTLEIAIDKRSWFMMPLLLSHNSCQGIF